MEEMQGRIVELEARLQMLTSLTLMMAQQLPPRDGGRVKGRGALGWVHEGACREGERERVAA